MRLRVTLPLGEPTRSIRAGDVLDFRPVWHVPNPSGQPTFRILARVAQAVDKPDAIGMPCVRFVCDWWRTYEDDPLNDTIAQAVVAMADKILRIGGLVPAELMDGGVGVGMEP